MNLKNLKIGQTKVLSNEEPRCKCGEKCLCGPSCKCPNCPYHNTKASNFSGFLDEVSKHKLIKYGTPTENKPRKKQTITITDSEKGTKKSVEAKDTSWLEKEVKNPKTGNIVKVKSLPPEIQEKYRPKKEKKADDALKNKQGKIEPMKESSREKLKKEGSPTDFKGPSKDSDATSGDAEFDRTIVSKLAKLAEMAADAKAKGEKAPEYDLCEVSVPGTNLFCEGNKGIPRSKMPQLKGNAVPGSKADSLPKDKSGEVDTEALFKEALKEKGVKTTKKKVPAAALKATQNQLVGAKVAGMLEALKKDPTHEKITAPIYVSKDGYILDGHHRWAAVVGLDMADGKKEPMDMDVQVVDMSIDELVDFTNKFADEVGIAQKKASSNEEKVKAAIASLKLGRSVIIAKPCCKCCGKGKPCKGK